MNIEVNSSKQVEKDKNKNKAQPKPNPRQKDVSELRQDIVTGDWVVIATGRAKRPDDFAKVERIKDDAGIGNCLFEDPVASGQYPDVLIYKREDGEWTLRIFPNKFPAFSRGIVPRGIDEGPYFGMTGTGYHEIVVTRDHYTQVANMDKATLAEVFDAYQDRYLDLMKKKSVNYIAIFHNHGKECGASIPHPHSQIMAIPVISPYITQELNGAETHYKQNKKCVYCDIAEYESEKGERVVFENDEFIAFCPFSSRAAFEVWVMPKKHNPYFERVTNNEKFSLSEVFGKAMNSIYRGLNDPPYNFYIHTSPCDGKDYPHFHWHIEILPHTAIWAGFELDTGIEISTIKPETAAEFLREKLEE